MAPAPSLSEENGFFLLNVFWNKVEVKYCLSSLNAEKRKQVSRGGGFQANTQYLDLYHKPQVYLTHDELGTQQYTRASKSFCLCFYLCVIIYFPHWPEANEGNIKPCRRVSQPAAFQVPTGVVTHPSETTRSLSLLCLDGRRPSLINKSSQNYPKTFSPLFPIQKLPCLCPRLTRFFFFNAVNREQEKAKQTQNILYYW